MNRRGFTLIELMVALLLLALLSGTAALSFHRPLNSLRIDASIAALRHFDADARAAARALGQPQRILFDATHRRLQRLDGDDLSTLRRQIDLGGESWQLRVENQPQTQPIVAVDISADGWSRSYSIELANRTLDIAGLSGQITERR